jgi:DNA-3-methyladenine glycosylase II
MAALMGKDISKLKAKGGKWKYMSEKDMLEISEKFSPYRSVKAKRRKGHLLTGLLRSVFMWYMWRVENIEIATFEK